MAEPTGGRALAPPKGLREADRPRAAAEEGAGFRRFGRYEIQEPLPGSDVGELYRARDTDRDRTLALTILPTECSSDRDFVNHFRRVMPVVATLTAPGIVPVGYFGMFDRRLYIATRLIEAERLAVVLEREGALLPARAVRVVDQVAEALDALHAVGVVHGGIGPSAILLGPDDSVLVTDIGLAPPVNVTPAALGLGGRTAGTLAYMAPEWLTRRQVSPRADVYSLACLLVECLTGAPPYPVRDLPSLLYAHLYLAPTPEQGSDRCTSPPRRGDQPRHGHAPREPVLCRRRVLGLGTAGADGSGAGPSPTASRGRRWLARYLGRRPGDSGATNSSGSRGTRMTPSSSKDWSLRTRWAVWWMAGHGEGSTLSAHART